MPAPIDFFFDFYSPYAYLASTRIDRIAERFDRAVVWRPIMLGPVFKVMGLKPLVEVPLLDDYARRDMDRCAREMGIPFRLPEGFPKAALAASRAFYWLQDRDPYQARVLATLVFAAIFSDGRDGSDPGVIADLVAPFGIERAQFLAAIQTPKAKERLRQETAAAIELGVCGSPFMIVDGEPFWGNDRMEQMQHWLESGGW